jgi:hypothetical protein
MTPQFHEGQEVEVYRHSPPPAPIWRRAKICDPLPVGNEWVVQFHDGSRGVFDAEHIRPIDCEGPPRRPRGANADEWHLFLCGYLDNRASFPRGLTYVAVEIAEAIEAAEKRGWRRSS